MIINMEINCFKLLKYLLHQQTMEKCILLLCNQDKLMHIVGNIDLLERGRILLLSMRIKTVNEIISLQNINKPKLGIIC